MDKILLCGFFGLVCVLTVSPLSLQLAYCVVQFMEKDATVTEYVRLPFNYPIKLDSWMDRSLHFRSGGPRHFCTMARMSKSHVGRW